MSKYSIEGFVVIESFKHDSTRIRVWIFNNNIDAYKFHKRMEEDFGNKYNYRIRRANIGEI